MNCIYNDVLLYFSIGCRMELCPHGDTLLLHKIRTCCNFKSLTNDVASM